MKKNSVISLSIFLAILFTILYILLSAKPLAKEYQFSPVWKISASNPSIKEAANGENVIHYHLGQTIGYFTEDGNISVYQTFPSKVSISDYYYATYDTDAENTPFYNSKNKLAGTLKASGFPYFVDDLIYIFLPGGASFSKCLPNGDIQWTYEGTIPITAFAAKPGYTAIGLADGTIKVFENNTGSNEISFEPGGSDFPVILGLDISPDGQYVASVSGHNKQRFVLSHREGNQQKIIFHRFLDEDSPYRTSVYFTKDAKRIFYNYENKLGIYDFETQENTEILLKNKIISLKENDNFVFLLSKNKKLYTVSIIENTNTKEGEFSFEADSAFIQTAGDKLYIGKDNTISCISITKE